MVCEWEKLAKCLCRKKEVGYNCIEHGVEMEALSDNTVNPSGSTDSFLSSWITLHCYSFYAFLSGAILVIILGFGVVSLTGLFQKSWHNVVVSFSSAEVSKEKNKKWKSWKLRHFHVRPLRYLARSDAINYSDQNLCHKNVWFRVDLRLSQSMQMHGVDPKCCLCNSFGVRYIFFVNLYTAVSVLSVHDCA